LTSQRRKSDRAYLLGQISILALVAIIAINFVSFLPLYMGEVMTYEAWRAHMWFASWI